MFNGSQCLPILIILLGTQAWQAQSNRLRWEGLTPYTTIHGDPCVTPCEKRGQNYHWCHTLPEKGTWNYCSSKPGEDYRGKSCHSNCQPHKKYFFCYTDSRKNWDYCGRTLSFTEENVVVAQHKTRYGKYCVSECQKSVEEHEHNWCYVEDNVKERDFCSILPGHDISGGKCKSTCDFHGKDYTWCHLESGGWNYCGVITVSSTGQFTDAGSKCITPCQLESGGSTDNVCYDATRVKRKFSRVAKRATNNLACAHSCSTEHCEDSSCSSKKYSWCRTSYDKSSWGYCSAVTENRSPRKPKPNGWSPPRMYFPRSDIEVRLTHSKKLNNIYSHWNEQGNNRVTFFEAVKGNQLHVMSDPEDLELQKNCIKCLAEWKKNFFDISDKARQVLAESVRKVDEQVVGSRLYQENRFKDVSTGVEYVRLQLQINDASKFSAVWPKVAEVEVSVELGKEYPEQVVDALLESMGRGKSIYVERFSYMEMKGNYTESVSFK